MRDARMARRDGGNEVGYATAIIAFVDDGVGVENAGQDIGLDPVDGSAIAIEHLLDLQPIRDALWRPAVRSEEHTSELQSLMRSSYAVFCLKKKNPDTKSNIIQIISTTS